MAEENEPAACIVCLQTLEPETTVRICFGCFGYSVCMSCTEEICTSYTKKCPRCRSQWFSREYNMTYTDAKCWSNDVKPFAISRRRERIQDARLSAELVALPHQTGINEGA